MRIPERAIINLFLIWITHTSGLFHQVGEVEGSASHAAHVAAELGVAAARSGGSARPHQQRTRTAAIMTQHFDNPRTLDWRLGAGSLAFRTPARSHSARHGDVSSRGLPCRVAYPHVCALCGLCVCVCVVGVSLRNGMASMADAVLGNMTMVNPTQPLPPLPRARARATVHVCVCVLVGLIVAALSLSNHKCGRSLRHADHAPNSVRIIGRSHSRTLAGITAEGDVGEHAARVHERQRGAGRPPRERTLGQQFPLEGRKDQLFRGWGACVQLSRRRGPSGVDPRPAPERLHVRIFLARLPPKCGYFCAMLASARACMLSTRGACLPSRQTVATFHF